MGTAVGYKVRFNDHLSDNTYIKIMTDGILLNEIQTDRFLEQYDTLIIDEAHERSLNIDFILGYLKQILPKRPDLKVIITSATIDPERFSKQFDNAPIIEVSGRTYPVETRYRPLELESDDEGDRDLQSLILDAVDEVSREGLGDILIFLSGERDIRETAESLRKHHPPHTEIVPLYARLSIADQNKVFATHTGRRIVLATNVAETSLTVPGIRYVIDTGIARISRYSYRTKVQRLPIEKISQASADQRKGRCGRVSAGICIRLYSEEDFLNRPKYTEPEILRTNLASVILQMKSLKFGDINYFPFIDSPDYRLINDGFKLLQELSAIDQHEELTKVGFQLAKLPLDPRIGRMILAANDNNCLNEILIIASALSIQDPRERPLDKQQKADEAHNQFVDEQSDFLSFLKLWEFYEEHKRHLTKNKLRKLCEQNFLSFVRMREWQDIHSQLLTQVKDLGFKINQFPVEYPEIHQSLLCGLLGNIGFNTDQYEYTGARNSKFGIFPGSTLYKKNPKWIMAAEIIETTKLYAHCVAKIEPEWIERLAPHLLKRSYFEPHWEKRPARVTAYERTALYGLTITTKRKINYGPIDPKTSREIFIREALVAGHYFSDAPFFKHNMSLIREIENLEHKSRRQDILIDEHILYQFYDERLPDGIYSGVHFEKWRKTAEQDNSELLFLTKEYLMRHSAQEVTEERFPENITLDGIQFHLQYHFEPGHVDDGITAIIPLTILNQVKPDRFDWLVPGLLREKIIFLIKSLPKTLRKNFVPAPNIADACMSRMKVGEGRLLQALETQLKKMTGIALPHDAWQTNTLPVHLQMNFSIIDQKGTKLATGRDLLYLQKQFGSLAAKNFNSLPNWEGEKAHVTSWDFGDLPEQVEIESGDIVVRGYPAIVDKKIDVSITLCDSLEKAKLATRSGLCRLFMLQIPQQIKYLQNNLTGLQQMCLHYTTVGTCEELKYDLVTAILDHTFIGEQHQIRKQTEFEVRLEQGRKVLLTNTNELCALVSNILSVYYKITKRLKGKIPPLWLPAVKELKEQLQHLVYPGFVSKTPVRWLQQYPRYLNAIETRLQKLEYASDKDRKLATQIAPLWKAYLDLEEAETYNEGAERELEQYRWMIEELRVSLFAQELKTIFPISIQRVEKQREQIKNLMRSR